MTVRLDIRLAMGTDADAIASLSRREIEHELPWKWTSSRVRHAIADRATNVAVAYAGTVLVAFGIMSYRDEVAHLQLLAVHPAARRRGIGTSVLLWLEKVARVAGSAKLCLEARQDNAPALAFYCKHGYSVQATRVGMYYGLEDGVRLEKEVTGDNGTH